VGTNITVRMRRTEEGWIIGRLDPCEDVQLLLGLLLVQVVQHVV